MPHMRSAFTPVPVRQGEECASVASLFFAGARTAEVGMVGALTKPPTRYGGDLFRATQRSQLAAFHFDGDHFLIWRIGSIGRKRGT